MKASSALDSDSGPCMMAGCCGLGGGKDGRQGEVVKRTPKRPLPSSEPELWATGKRRSRRDSRVSLVEKQEDAASTLEWTTKRRRRESGPVGL